ncbi:hypothetical protein DM01DRAFT_321635 [Hesseltinella vesiculosa]|uniref:Uncharacterized protein n=1 Tax=Hesseltinella vesiculosa TaxID=101127 RepID=A0A1X2GG81_9FUNG|nr:hypothetical protein DM01DRAFT_321635 [Hesseltinella vesiculosa]
MDQQDPMDDGFTTPISSWTRRVPPRYDTVKDLHYTNQPQTSYHGSLAHRGHAVRRPASPFATISTPSASYAGSSRPPRIDSLYVPQLHHIPSNDHLPKYHHRKTIAYVPSTIDDADLDEDNLRTWPRLSAPPPSTGRPKPERHRSIQPGSPIFNYMRRSISSYSSSDLPLDHLLHQWPGTCFYAPDPDSDLDDDEGCFIATHGITSGKRVKRKRSLAPIVNPEVIRQPRPPLQALNFDLPCEDQGMAGEDSARPSCTFEDGQLSDAMYEKPLPPRPTSLRPFSGTLPASISTPIAAVSLHPESTPPPTSQSSTALDSDAMVKQFYATPIQHSSFDLDTLLLVAHGEQYLSQRENTRWSDDDDEDAHKPYAFHRWPSKSNPSLTFSSPGTLALSSSTPTIVAPSLSASTIAASPTSQGSKKHLKANQDGWVNEVYEELHRIVHTHVVF